MPYPRKFIDPVTTTVRLERSIKNIAEALRIELTTALAEGLDLMIRDRLLYTKTVPRIPREVLSAYLAERDRELQAFSEYLNFTAEDRAAARKKRTKAEEQEATPLLIYDQLTERRIVIQARDFKSFNHTLIREATEEDKALYGPVLRSEAVV